MKRAMLLVGLVLAFLLVTVVIVVHHDDQEVASVTLGSTSCVRDARDILTAQSVPSAQLVPCLTDAAASWSVTSTSFTNEGTEFLLRNQTVPDATWQMSFASTCQPDAGATTHDTQVSGVATTASVFSGRLLNTSDTTGVAQITWTRFAGGCVTATVSTPGSLDRQLILDETERLLVLIPRQVLADDVLRANDGRLSL